MLKELKNIDEFESYLRDREVESSSEVVKSVIDIIDEVKKNKDKALIEYTEKFDGVKLDNIKVSKEEIEEAYNLVDKDFLIAMNEAMKNIEEFHKKQVKEGYEIVKEDNVYLGQRVLPLEKVGVYVPGGTAAYPSSVLMNVIPAKIAGVKKIVMTTPPSKDNRINPYILATAKLVGIDTIYKVGGAQAVAALAYGTETVMKVDKIVGPGNTYVANAKKLVYGKVDIDMIAGPSEILVIADENADPVYVASDLISQAEHDVNASSILLTTSCELLEEVNKELVKQSFVLARKDIIIKSLENYGVSMILDSIEECINVSNQIAPEHLELMVENPKSYLDLIENAGSVFLGYTTCESIGDYFGGTNHVLPTNGTARFYSALNVDNYTKKSSYIHYSKEALDKVGDMIINIANHEGLHGHANAVKVRMKK
ncbi:MAG: histidinol dehydrogenase [Erysipelotrichaceae bacterium]|nr:histidinol dehydrogenase [Erysipelotrichaceae bacterium]